MAKTPKRPRDTNQLAKLIVGLSTDKEKATLALKGRTPPKRKAASPKTPR